MLIDTGVGGKDSETALNRQLSDVGSSLSKIQKIVLTHLHRDHSGLVNQIKEKSKAIVYAYNSGKKYSVVEPYDKNELFLKEYIRFGGASHIIPKLLSWIPNEPFQRLEIQCKLEDGDYLDSGKRFKIIWTPGHSFEHMCIHDRDLKVLFSGDHVLPRITPHLSLHFNEKLNPLKDYLESLEKIRSLDVKLVLPAHEFQFRNLEERVKEIERHHSSRLEEIKNAVRGGNRTVYQIASKISWISRPWLFMPFWVKHMASCETYAHLVYLKTLGEVSESLKNEILYYEI